jgi:uncharacterized protein
VNKEAKAGNNSPAPGVIKIDKEGAWFYNGRPIINTTIFTLFNKQLEEDGRGGYRLTIDGECFPLEVEDTPYVVSSLRESVEAGLVARLNDGTDETFALETLRIDSADIPYCRVKSGRFPARLLRAAWNALAPLVAHEEESGRYYLRLGARKHYLTGD